jgi:hypothetical protein
MKSPFWLWVEMKKPITASVIGCCWMIKAIGFLPKPWIPCLGIDQSYKRNNPSSQSNILEPMFGQYRGNHGAQVTATAAKKSD